MAMQSNTAAGASRSLRHALGRLSQEEVVAAVTVVLLIGFALALPGFATTANLLDLVRGI